MNLKTFFKLIEDKIKTEGINAEKGIEETYNEFLTDFTNRTYDIPTNIQKGEISKATEHLEHIAFNVFKLWHVLKMKGDNAPETINPEFSKVQPE